MKISLKWLSEYVKLPESPRELASRLTMAGLEVEAIENLGAALEGIVVAQIKDSKPHPNADKLSVTQVDAGSKGTLQIVCGAKNYKVGDKVPLATEGTKLPNGTEIKQAALRGVESFGMLCSARELGLSEEASGLMILDGSLEPGLPIARALGLDDTTFEINVTPNRPDALSHLGIAREVAVLLGAKLTPPTVKLKESSALASERVKISIEDVERCPRYAARVIENVNIGPSPAWLVDRLKACGIRSINNIVDITNYVLLECGHPLHAFDLDALAGPAIIVRRAKAKETVVTLDGKERVLDTDDLIICDRDRPQGIAGVMGGGKSEVTGTTKRILLEAAWFQPASVRRSAKRHGLHTEASHRFERGADISVIRFALDRAAALIAELSDGSVLKGMLDLYPQPMVPKKVALQYSRVSELLGVAVPADDSLRILEAIGFVADDKSYGGATFVVPFARVDVQREEDLVEEIARIRGYDLIPNALPRSMASLAPEPPAADAERRVRRALAGIGFDEVVNYSFVSPDAVAWTTPGPAASLGEPQLAIAIKNPLSVEQSVMRRSLYAGLLQNLSHNLRHQSETLRLYELGRSYQADPEGDRKGRPVAIEQLTLAGVLWGKRDGRTWAANDVAIDFHDAKGAVEAVLRTLGIPGATFSPSEAAPYHPRASATVAVGGKVVGAVGELHPRVSKHFDLPGGVFIFELDAQLLYSAATLIPRYQSLSRFPSVLRDLAVVVPAELQQESVRSIILEVGRPLVEDAIIFDVYTGKPIPDGKKNVAYALRYRAADRTLTDVEVNQAHARIVEELNRRVGGSLRGA